jgi:hypothetical protein
MRQVTRVAVFLICGVMAMSAANKHGNMSGYQDDLNAAKAAGKNTPDRQTAVANLLNVAQHPGQRLLLYAYDQVIFDAFVSTWQRSRVDKQAGSGAGSSGTTDLVSRPSTPQLLGLAMETGALTQSVSGTVATFRGNAEGVLRTIAGEPVGCLGCMTRAGLRNVNFGVSFDLSRQGTQQATTSGAANSATPPVSTVLLPNSSRQLSAVNVRYDIYNPKDTRSPQFQDAWASWFTAHQADLEAAGDDLLKAISDFLLPLTNDTKYLDLRVTYTSKLNAADPAQIESLLDEFLSKTLTIARSVVPSFDQRLLAVKAAYAKYSQVYDDAFIELRGKPQFSLEYTFTRPVNQPDTHNIRLVFGVNPYGGKGLLSANLATTFYNEVQTGALYGRLRDFQVAAQFDRPLGNVFTHPAVFTLAGYMQYQFDPSVINISPGLLVPGTSITLPKDAQVLLGPKGTMGIAQAKLTLKMGDTGMKIPIGVSWASRTDLIDATDVRGHIGITYDLDTLFNNIHF